VTFDGSCSLIRPGSAAVFANFHVHLSENGQPGDYGTDAAAMSRIIGQLADEIVAALHTAAKG
jgi:hypothetical protein